MNFWQQRLNRCSITNNKKESKATMIYRNIGEYNAVTNNRKDFHFLLTDHDWWVFNVLLSFVYNLCIDWESIKLSDCHTKCIQSYKSFICNHRIRFTTEWRWQTIKKCEKLSRIKKSNENKMKTIKTKSKANLEGCSPRIRIFDEKSDDMCFVELHTNWCKIK